MFISRIRKAAKWISDTFYQKSLFQIPRTLPEMMKNAHFTIKKSGSLDAKLPGMRDREIAVNTTLNILYYKPEGQEIKVLPIPEDLTNLLREGFVL